MQNYISFNGRRGGSKGSSSCQPLAEYDKLIAQPWLHEMIVAIRRGDNKQKGLLPFRCAHYYRFANDHRCQKSADPTSFLFQTTVDIDEPGLVEDALEMAKLLNREECWNIQGRDVKNPWKGMLLHLEYSARKKLHIDIRMPLGMTIEETQRGYCEALGVPCDESCFTPERIIFITDKESEIYRSPHWYEILPAEEVKLRQEAFLKRGLSIDGRGNVSQIARITPVQAAGKAIKNAVNNAANTASSASSASPESRKSSANGKNLIAFDMFQELAGLKGVAIDSQGSRHSSLLAIMSAGASRIMAEDELRKVVEVKMPSFAKEADCQQLIHDFYLKYGDNYKLFNRDVMKVNAEAEKRAQEVKSEERRVKDSLGFAAGSVADALAAYSEIDADAYPNAPAMPEKLPKLVELLLSKTPEIYKPAVAHAIFPPLATHLWHTRFRYIDNVEHEATLMCVLMAGTGAGKSCVQRPINYIMADIRKRDKQNMEREKKWKDEMTLKGANKDKRKRPENLVIQEIDADMTNPAFVMRTAEAQEHFLYTSLNEIDQFDALQGRGKQQFRIMCLAFDPDNQYGQTRVGAQSVTERVTIRFNWNASTTIKKGQGYFSKVLTDGPISRINFCTIPERMPGTEMPIYGIYDDTFADQLQPYIDNLCQATGLIDCPEALALARKLYEENMLFARVSQDAIYENLSFRANVIAYLKACVLFVANGMKWEPEMEEFICWSEKYDLWCKMRFFGDSIKNVENAGDKSSRRGPGNLLQLLPDVFNYQQLIAIREEHGLDEKGAVNTLKQWVYRKYIVKVSANPQIQDGYSYSSYSFKKLKFRKDGLELDA